MKEKGAILKYTEEKNPLESIMHYVENILSITAAKIYVEFKALILKI